MKQEKEKKTSLNGGPKIEVKDDDLMRDEDLLRIYNERRMRKEGLTWAQQQVVWVDRMTAVITRHDPNCRNPKAVALMTFGLHKGNYWRVKKGKIKNEKIKK